MNENKYFIVMTTVVCIAITLILFTRSEPEEGKTINGIDFYERCMDKEKDQYECTQRAVTWLRKKSNESHTRVR